MTKYRSFAKPFGLGITVLSALPMTIGFAGTLSAADTAAEKPNTVVILADDLGYNDLGCYGARDPGIKTPNIDRMAAQGVKFTNWFSACSVCAPSRADT